MSSKRPASNTIIGIVLMLLIVSSSCSSGSGEDGVGEVSADPGLDQTAETHSARTDEDVAISAAEPVGEPTAVADSPETPTEEVELEQAEPLPTPTEEAELERAEPTPTPNSIEVELAAAASDRPEPAIWEDWRLQNQTFFDDFQGSIGALVGPLPVWLNPGTWNTDALGTSVSLELAAPLAIVNENPGVLLFEALPGHPDSPRLWLTRPVATIDDGSGDFGGTSRTDRVGPDVEMPEDVLAWLNTIDLLTTEVLDPTMVGSEAAGRVRLAPARALPALPATCGIGNGQCIDLFATAGTGISPKIAAGHLGEIWEVEQPGTDIVVLATALDGDAEQWFETVAELLSSSTFGDPQPPAYSEFFPAVQGILDPGTYRFRTFPDLQFTLAEPVRMHTTSADMLFRPEGRGNYGYWIRRVDFDVDLEPVDSVQRAVETIENRVEDHILSQSTSQLAGIEAVSIQIRRPWNNPFPLFYAGPLLDRPVDELFPYTIGSSHDLQVVELSNGVFVFDLGWPNESEEEGALAFYDSIGVAAAGDS